MKKWIMSMLFVHPIVASAFQGELEIDRVSLHSGEVGKTELSGVAHNISKRSLKNIQLTYVAYEDGIKIQEGYVEIATLQPDESQAFSTQFVNGFDNYTLEFVNYQYVKTQP